MIRVSGVTYDRPVGKRIERRADGSGIEKTANLDARGGPGAVLNKAFATAREAFEFRLGVDSRTMFVTGTFAADCGATIVVPKASLEVVSHEFETWQDEQRVAVDGNHLAFRQGRGIMSIDIDVCKATNVYPEKPKTLESPEEVRDALLALLPEAEGAPMLVMPSSSSMIEDSATGQLISGPGGWRVLVVVSDATAIPRLLDTIHKRAWAQLKWCHAYVSQGGSILMRSVADQALGRPTQPDYPCAELGPGLRKSSTATRMYDLDGGDLDPSRVVLSRDHDRRAQENMSAAKAALKGESESLRRRAVSDHARALVTRGIDPERAERAAEAIHSRRTLLGSDLVQFANGQSVSVGELLGSRGADLNEQICLDPLEPGYDGSRPVAKFYHNSGQRPIIFSYARGERTFHLRHDGVSALRAIQDAGGDQAAIVRAVGLAEVSDLEMDQLERSACKALKLGNKVKSFRREVEAYRVRHGINRVEVEVESDEAFDGPVELSEPLRPESFPFIQSLASGGVSPIGHQSNIAHLLERYGFEYRYNTILKEITWAHPECPSEGDNRDNLLYAQLSSLCNLNKVPTKDLETYLTAVAEERSCNPVTDYLASLRWDGTSRIADLATSISPGEPSIAEIALRLFLIGACAAADHAVIARLRSSTVRPSFEYVLVLVGAQGLGKTKGLGRLLPKALQDYYKQGVVLDPRDKDAVKLATSAWITELGELDATFRKADIEHLKGFLSREVDELRMPYARKSSKFMRRTVFCGTVNDEAFLADRTGNRRFLPLKVGRIEIDWSAAELDQLWAEAWSRYVAGESWWPGAGEDQLLSAHAERFRARNWIEEVLERLYAWDVAEFTKLERRTATEIFRDLCAENDIRVAQPKQNELKEIAACMKRLWSERSDVVNENGELLVAINGERQRVHVQGGKANGWLVPLPQLSVLLGQIPAKEAIQDRK